MPTSPGYRYILHFATASRWLFFVGVTLVIVRLFGPSPSWWLIWALIASPVIAVLLGVGYFLKDKNHPIQNTEPGGSPGTEEKSQ